MSFLKMRAQTIFQKHKRLNTSFISYYRVSVCRLKKSIYILDCEDARTRTDGIELVKATRREI